jgi:shikimate kinase
MQRAGDLGNVVLIGMPAVGKSTLGVLLAKATGRGFIDTDVHIQAQERRTLQHIIETEGAGIFRAIEERAVLALDLRHTVIATGGSVVYSPASMAHLRSLGPIVHLHLEITQLRQRIGDLAARGVVRTPGQTLDDLFTERAPLYRRYADVTVDCSGRNHEEAVEEIMRVLDGG